MAAWQPFLCFLAFFGIQFFVGAPAEFGRLQAFGDEAFDRPGVPEDVERLRMLGALGVAFGDVDALDADLLHQLGPAFAVMLVRLVELDVEIVGKVDQRLLDEPGNHARVCAAGRNGGCAARVLGLFLAQGFAQRIVRAVGVLHVLVEVEAEPRLDDRVDVENVELAAELHQVDRAGVDREVDAETLAAAFGEKRLQEVLVVVLGDIFLDVADAMLGQDFHVGRVLARVDDNHPALVEFEVALDQGQGAAADGAEADHDDRSGDFAVNRVGYFCHFSLSPADGFVWAVEGHSAPVFDLKGPRA